MLSRLLFTIVLETLSREIRQGCPGKLLHAYDLALVSETPEGLKGKLEALKGGLESKEMTVNVKTTKMIISSENGGKVTIEGTFLCAVCRKGIGSNFIICQFCMC